MSSISRRLSLHASALSDDEYQLYTTSLLSIVSVEEDDGGVSQSQNIDDYEKMNINVRETRAWIRGRYSHISYLIIDKILKLFSPNLSATDSLSGGEFFAVLRLVVHAENGKEVDRSLAFVQAQVRQPVPPRRTYTDPSLATSSPSVVESSSSHNPFTHPQPPLHPSQRSEPTSHNPFVHRNLLPARSEDGNAKLPPLPPRKLPAPPTIHQHPSITAAPPKHHSHLDRSRSPSKQVATTNPLISSHPHSHPPSIPPKPSHHVTSTLIKQSLQATKAAQTMKKAEEQLERERVMQVLKSSSTVSGTNVYNQHQYQRQQMRSPSPTMGHGQGGAGGGPGSGLKKLGYATSSASSGSDERAPPLPRRRTQQPSPPLSISSLEQVALATTRPYPTSAPPTSTVSAFSNTEISNHRVYSSRLHSRSRDPVDPAAVPYTSSPEQSPRRMSLDLPSGGTTRGRPPPTHPDRKPHHLQYEYQRFSNSHPHSHSQSYSDPFAGSNLDFREPPPEQHATNTDESFESIYGPSSSSPFTNPIPPTSPQTIPNPNRASRSKSLHQLSPPVPPVPRSSLGRKRPESVQVFRASDIGVEEDGKELMGPPSPNWNNNSSASVSRRTSLMTPPTLAANNKNTRRSSLSISSSSSSLNQSGNWPPPSPNRQTQFGGISSSSSLTVSSSLAGGQHPRPPSSTSTTTTKPDSISTPTPSPLTSLQKTFLQIQPHLDKARYKAEAGLSKRGFVRGKSSGSGGVNGEGGGEEDGLEDGLEGLMGGSSDGGGKNQVGQSRWRVQDDGSVGSGLDRVYDREVDQDSDWTRSEGMSMPHHHHRAQRQYSDGDGNGDGLEKDNLKWPVGSGEGWKPL